MSVALDKKSNLIEGSGFIHGMSCISIFEPPEIIPGEQRVPSSNLVTKVEEREEELDSCSSSSIGRNSDVSSDGDGSGEMEVQSSFKGPLDTMDALEDVLPFRRGISKFYCGKSKSFTSLADVSSSSSVKDIAKPENSYSRKRKNLLNNMWDKKNRNFLLRSNNGGGISKRHTNLSRSTLALAIARRRRSSSDSNNTSDNSNSNSPSPPRLLPPLYPLLKPSFNDGSSSPPPPRRNGSPWRSFSLADLQCATNGNY